MAPTVRSFSVEFDPLALIARYPERYPALLESSAPRAGAAGVDILPMVTGERLRLDGANRLSGAHAAGARGFLEAMEGWWQAQRMPADPSVAAPRNAARSSGAVAPTLPFAGGWLLYLGYELAREIEPKLRLPPSPDAVIAMALRAPAAWVRERDAGNAWVICEPGAEALLEEFGAHVAALVDASVLPGPPGAPLRVVEEPPAAFLTAVEEALAHIAAGDVYQANLSRGWHAEAQSPVASLEVYRRLRQTNPSPFGAYFTVGDFAVVSSSPERLVALREGIVATRPIAGTRPRGDSPAADRELIRTLLGDEKERAEHVMLIDLERNDVGRVCVAGSVQVDEFMTIETYAHVHHIVSNVQGRQRSDVSPIDVLRALFPGGSITGCPKVRCMQLIADIEGVGRGAYTGSLGYLNRDGSGDFNILIRTLTVSGRRLRFRAGAGIVADSDPRAELSETRAKAEGLLRALL